MKPPVSSCSAASVRRCATQWAGVSTWPYIIVDVVGRPIRCAVPMISSQVAAGSLPLVSTQRTSSSRISAAVPGTLSSPASLAASRNSSNDSPVRAAPLTISMGEKACRWMPGWRRLHLAGEVEVGGAGQVGVDAALHADLGGAGRPGLVDPVADLLHRQRVGVGVGAPLGERAEPAAGVADVGEVDVPVHDVGDVVAVDVGAHGVGQRAEVLQVGAVGAEQRQVLGVGQPGRVLLGVQQRGEHLAVAGGQRGGVPVAGGRRPFAQLGPVAVDGVEVRLRRSAGAARRCRPRRAGRPGPTTSRPRRAPATATRPGCAPRRRARPARPARTRAGAPAGPATARADSTYGGWAASRSRSSNPASAGERGQLVDVRPRPLGVDVVRGERARPRPSRRPRPAAAGPSSVESDRLGGACTRALGPSSSRVTATAATYSCRSRSSCAAIAVRGLARKFWTITSCTCPCRCAEARIAPIASTRSA